MLSFITIKIHGREIDALIILKIFTYEEKKKCEDWWKQ